MYWAIFFLITGIKLLLMPAYFSTDFEVHRNWLAITHSLPIGKWYYEDTSEWTLDYPPFFAYFEWFLSQFAQFFDAEMLNVENVEYASPKTILFQRLSVMVTDVVYLWGVKSCLETIVVKGTQQVVGACLLIGNIGLLMVDHIHFQYNGILFGILLLSIARTLQEKYVQAAFFFAYLLHMKHIFMYVAPVYLIYLFRFYCLRSHDWYLSFSKLALTVVGVSVVSIYPFVGMIPQLIARLFPFKRGLSHAYWAPNFWAIYNFVDKILSIALKKQSGVAAGTGGLVKTYEHTVLPHIQPNLTFILTAVCMIPCLIKLWSFKFDRNMAYKFIKSIVICACTSFMFGWHVHEKAILMVIIPLSLLAPLDKFEARMTFFLGTIGFYSLFPLLFRPELLFIKIGLFGLYTAGSYYAFQRIHTKDLLSNLEIWFLLGLGGLFFYENSIHYVLKFNIIFPFLPLMLTSVYCSVGIVYFWLLYYYQFLSIDVVRNKPKTKTIGNITGQQVTLKASKKTQ